MLCPEVWNFKPPRHYEKIEDQNDRLEAVANVITKHYFNHSVSVILPDTVSVPGNLLDSINNDSDYYKVKGLRASELISKEFIEAFVKKGRLTLLTIENRIDLHNCLALTPSGCLILSLTRDDFQTLGLEGKPSFFVRKTKSRYVVTINLKDDNFTPGRKFYEHVRRCFKERFKQTFNVILAWEPPETKVCPSSIAAWFHQRGYVVSLCSQSFIRRAEHSITIPLIDDDTDHEKFFEWLGILSVGGDLKNVENCDYVNSYQCPTPSTLVGQVQYLQWTGLFTCAQVQKIYIALKEFLQSREDLLWVSLHIQGFEDAPISWDLKEHSFFTDGDNSYTFVLRVDGKHILRRSLSSNNKLRIFL
ncbi:ribonuclease P protein subunit p40-like [Orussus abietinus]|uniref:ribonuclease P protein subunit p40-like n=1 Tax=Orussus abietinus TaxID=222816 RepID=UPI00062623D5|nr:ribonuclease P protein subunit p40-like [Orussus abietinus]